MAEMLVRLFDKYTGKDPHFLAKTTKRGDVIVVQDNKWPWSDLERKSPDWIIVTVDMPIEKARAMLAKELGPEDKNGMPINPLLQLRAFKVDLDAMTVLGYPIYTQMDAIKLKFATTAKGQGKGDPDPLDPIAACIADIQSGDRIVNDAAQRAVSLLPILEVHFDACKVAKAPIADDGIIGRADDEGIIG